MKKLTALILAVCMLIAATECMLIAATACSMQLGDGTDLGQGSESFADTQAVFMLKQNELTKKTAIADEGAKVQISLIEW